MPRTLSTGTTRLITIGLVAAGAALVTAASCDYWALSVNGGTGLVFIAVGGDGTGAGATGGYRVRVRQDGVADRVVAVPAGRELELQATGTGPVELMLVTPTGCRVTSPNPLRLVPATDHAVHASFALACTAAG
jgi:hypothetical protein